MIKQVKNLFYQQSNSHLTVVLLLLTFYITLNTYPLCSQEPDIDDIELKNVYPKIVTPKHGSNENNFVFFSFNNPFLGDPKLKIFSYEGYRIKEIPPDEIKPNPESSYEEGYWYLVWDGKDSSENFVLPGVYIFQFETPKGKIYTGTIIVAR